MEVTWLGQSAVYTDQERQEMAVLPAGEAAVLHLLKSTFDGREITRGTLAAPESVESPVPADNDPGNPLAGQGFNKVGAPEMAPPSSILLDPEDIPFGEAGTTADGRHEASPKIPRKDQVIVLRWTWNKGRVCKTKKLAARKMKAWRRWYIRQGWKVQGSSSGDGLIAWKDESRHAITLRTYAKKKPGFPGSLF